LHSELPIGIRPQKDKGPRLYKSGPECEGKGEKGGVFFSPSHAGREGVKSRGTACGSLAEKTEEEERKETTLKGS